MILHRRQTPPAPRGRLWRLCALLCMALPLWHAAAAHGATDVRILIDVSASMKETDPRNLRVPALRLLTGLLPADSRAGVWTFGRHVNMLVPYGTVDAAWRTRAAQAAAGIGSFAPHSDIEAALRTASWNWLAPAANDERHLVLLAGGPIDVPGRDNSGKDISGSAAASAEARERITRETLPRLQRAGVRIHTIALSRGADEALLRQLAAATGGRFERIDDTGMLERAFLRLFEDTLPAVTLPLDDDQRFTVDADVTELTVLAFRALSSRPTRLLAPDGSVYSVADIAPNMRWQREDRYDLVTVTRPDAGDWRIDAAFDPDNRALIASELALVTQAPLQWLTDTGTALTAYLSAHGRVLDRNDFHHFLRVRAVQRAPSSETQRTLLLDNGRDGDALAGDGVYTLTLAQGLAPGLHELHIEVDGTTFRRARRHAIEVLALPLTIDLQHSGGIRELFVSPLTTLIAADSLHVTAGITNDGAFAGRHPVTRRTPNEWYLDLSAYDGPGPYEITLEIEAQRHDGRMLRRQQALRFGDFGVEFQPAAAAPAIADARRDAPASPPPRSDAGTGPDWARTGLGVMLINLLAGLIALLVYRRYERRQDAAAAAAVAEPASPDPAAPAVVAAAVAAAATAAENDTTSLPEELPDEVLAAYLMPLEEMQEQIAVSALAEEEPAGAQEQTDEFIERIMNGETAAGKKSDSDAGGSDDPLLGIDISDIELNFDERAPGTA